MTKEEKAKAYDEALERAKDMLSYKEVRREDMEYLFPELKENEDEKIRKWLIGYFHQYKEDGMEEYANGLKVESIIAWLEKQGFQRPTDEEMKEALRIEYEKGRADTIVEMQNPAWSEEDEEFLRRAINATKDAYPMTAKWLKSLKSRVQSKREWSEENARLLDNCISLIEDIPYTEEEQNWLKSLRPQNRWKPSDEQMKALHELNLTGNISYAGQGQVLIELYNNLKKLTE